MTNTLIQESGKVHEFHDVPKREFMKKFERYEVLIQDHSAMKEAKRCLRAYFFNYVLGFKSVEGNVIFAWGKSYHRFREVLAATNKDLLPSQSKLLNPIPAIMAGLKLWDKEQGQDPPQTDKFSFLTRARLLKSFAVAVEHVQREIAQGNIKVLSVEQAFNVEIKPDSGVYTSGRFDQAISVNGSKYIRDFKTTTQEGMWFSRGLNPNDQFPRYAHSYALLSGMKVKGVLIETLYNTKKQGPEITSYTVSFSDWQMEDWLKDELMHRRILDDCRNADTWPKNESACYNCRYHSVCRLNSENAQMYQLQQFFVQKPWRNEVVDE